jgi:hypothetical protein
MRKLYLSLIGLFVFSILAVAGTDPSNTFTLGDGTNASNKSFRVKVSGGYRDLRYNVGSGKWEFTEDGSLYSEIGSGGGGGGGGAGIILNLNSGFEEGTTNWTASGGTFTTTTTAADVGFDTTAGSWDPSAASQTLSNDLVTIPSGLQSKPCSLSWYYKGGDANYKAQVFDGTNVVAESSAFTTQSTYSNRQILYFTCPSSGQMRARFISSADAALIYLDDVRLGQEGIFEVQPDPVVSRVELQLGNGGGGTRTSIRRWTNVVENIGTDITYTDSATNGAEFLINTSGLYAISWSVRASAAVDVCITKNQIADFAVACNSIASPATYLVASAVTPGSGVGLTIAKTQYYSAGTVIRFFHAGTDDVTNFHNRVSIVKVQ